MRATTALCLGAALTASLGGCRADAPAPARLQSDLGGLDHTDFAAGPGAPLDPAANLLWSGSLKLAWDALAEPLGGEPRAAAPTPAWNQLAATDFGADDVDPAALTVRAGQASPALVRAVERALDDRGSPPDPTFRAAVEEAPAGALFAYAQIEKALPFAHRFDDLASAPLTFHPAAEGEARPVDAFGIASFSMSDDRHQKLSEQVRYHEREDRSEFCVVLTPSVGDDRIVLARVRPAATLEETWDRAAALIAANDERRLREADRFVAPELDFDLAHRFGDLEGLVLSSTEVAGAPLTIVRQDIRLRLDEEGMVFRSRAFMGAASAAVQDPRELLFDRPFLVAAFEEGSGKPYLLAWIAHPELLAPPE